MCYSVTEGKSPWLVRVLVSAANGPDYALQVLHRRICLSSAAHRKNIPAPGREKFSQEFIQKQVEEFNIGKRHLANMMDEDPENFSQEDIDVRTHVHFLPRNWNRWIISII